MKRLAFIAALIVGLVCSATAGWQSRDSNYNVAIQTGGTPVAFDACGIHGTGSGVSFSYTNLTVGAGLTNGILTVILVVGSNSTPPTGMSMTWDTTGSPQSLTAVPGSPAINGNQSIFAFYLLNPHAGNNTLTGSWTGSVVPSLVACSFQGASGVANFNSSTGGTPQQVAITAGASDAAFGAFSSPTNFSSTGAIQIDLDLTEPQWAIAWQRASGPNPTLTGNPGNATSLSAGFAIVH